MLKNYQVINRMFAGGALLMVLSAAHGGGVVYVDDDAPAGRDGASWNTAYRFLQDGLTDACAGGIAEIHVGQGTYAPDRDEANQGGTADRTATFRLDFENIRVLGGFLPGMNDPLLRDPANNVTVLSGFLVVVPFCGSPIAGKCFVPNGTVACDDADCCEAVCALDPDSFPLSLPILTKII